MTIEQMAERLGLNEAELEVLKAQEQARSLPGRYVHLRDYLGAQVLDTQNGEWVGLMDGILNVRRRTNSTFEAGDALHTKIRAFIKTL